MPEEIARASTVLGMAYRHLRHMRMGTLVLLLRLALVHMGKSFHSQDAADHFSVFISFISGSLPGYRSIFQTRLKNQWVAIAPRPIVRTTDLSIVVLLTAKHHIKRTESRGGVVTANRLYILPL